LQAIAVGGFVVSNSLYDGDVSPQDVANLLLAHPDARVIDVRTKAEWAYVGIPDLRAYAQDVILVEWQIYPSMQVNDAFVQQASQGLMASGAEQTSKLFFLCRSGVRSKSAAIAMKQAGFAACYNISDGFEGPPDRDGQRGKVAGWKASALPWRQG
jgi:rhodanese-related sulfurtransferase